MTTTTITEPTEPQSLPQSFSTKITSTATSTTTSTTTTSTSTTTTSETDFTGTQVLIPTDSRLLFIGPEIYETSSARIDFYFIFTNTIRRSVQIKIVKSCENISTDWNCSSGSKHHSVCIRSCQTDFQSEAIKCKCKNDQICRWERKGKACNQFHGSQDTNAYRLQGARNTGQDTGNTSGQFLFGQENRLLSDQVDNWTDLGQPINDNLLFNQILRDIQFSNSGQMVFNVNYYNNNYHKDPSL